MHSLLIATSNPHKLEELRAILGAVGIDAVGLDDVEGGPFEEPVEDEPTFEGNACKKALHYAAATGHTCLADDSGLEVDALGGEPGVRSARYCGLGETRSQRDKANNLRLLNALTGVPDDRRTARFVCAMCVATPEGEVIATARGCFEGRIAHSPRGGHGFGYDPLLIVTGDDPLAGRHAAELEPDEKHDRSHRGRAARQIAERLRASPIFR
jgi:XTP/dITP diphosphohydrolase